MNKFLSIKLIRILRKLEKGLCNTMKQRSTMEKHNMYDYSF